MKISESEQKTSVQIKNSCFCFQTQNCAWQFQTKPKFSLVFKYPPKFSLSILHSNLYPSKKEIPNIPFPTHPKSKTTFYSLNKQANKQSKKKNNQTNKQKKLTTDPKKKKKKEKQ